MIEAKLKEHLLQSLVHERGGVLIYRTALECAVNEDLRKEWHTYLGQTQSHVVVLSQLEEEEDEHLYHTQGWARELRLKALGLKAEIPPPEERRDVKSAAEAEDAKKSRKAS